MIITVFLKKNSWNQCLFWWLWFYSAAYGTLVSRKIFLINTAQHYGKSRREESLSQYFVKSGNSLSHFFDKNSWMQDPRCKHEYLENEPNLRKGQRMVMKVTHMYVEARDRRYSCINVKATVLLKNLLELNSRNIFLVRANFLFSHTLHNSTV